MAETSRKAVIIGISGPSSSGKTTLARLLRDVFPRTFILHQDDFYRAEEEIPSKDGVLDWDCAGALDFDEMARALEHIRAEGTFPPFIDSKEDQNSVGKCTVPDSAIDAAKKRVAAWLQPGRPGHALFSSSSSSSSSNAGLSICILDGFLLFGQEPPLERITNELLDIKILLTVSREKATRRREARDGYVTLEGFWKDPPGYVDKIVWPNYAESHAWLFENGDVEGWLDGNVLGEKGILALPGVVGSQGEGGDAARGLDVDMDVIFNWTVETLMRKLEEVTRK